jgi:hypothetical protein
MIKLRLKDKILLGLSEENAFRMLKGEPIFFKGEELGLDVDVFIFCGKDEAQWRQANEITKI